MTRFLMVFLALAGLLPRTAGAATYETLHVFAPNPKNTEGRLALPLAPLLMNAQGTVLYGILNLNDSIAYALTASSDGKVWTKSTIFTFPVPVNEGGIGCYPVSGLALDSQGNIFGSATGCYGSNDFGAVYELSPPKQVGARWTGTLIHRFGSSETSLRFPVEGLFLDADDNVYGGAVNTENGQSIYELVRPTSGKGWTERDIAQLPENDDQQSSWLMRDASGAIYGEGFGNGSSNAGDIWRLRPATITGAGWGYSNLAIFPACESTICPKGVFPNGNLSGYGLVMDRDGNLYGTATEGGLYGNGTVFKLTQPAAGKTQWTVSVLHSFKGTDGNDPQGLTIDAAGNLYGVALFGGIGWQSPTENSGDGVIYELRPPATPSGTWKFSILHKPTAAFFSTDRTINGGHSALNSHLMVGPDNKLYGTANGPAGSGGSVFRVAP